MRHLAVLLLLLSTAVACGGGGDLTFDGHPIEDPAGFLAKTEHMWRRHLADKSVTIHKDARCYFITPANSNEIRRGIFCGPVRYLEDPRDFPDLYRHRAGDRKRASLPQGGRWDTYTFDVEPGPDGVRLVAPSLSQTGITVPSAARLVRPDGEKPPTNPGRLAIPQAPSGTAGLVAVDRGVRLRKSLSPSDNKIVTPRTSVVIDTVGPVDAVATSDGPRSAARGERLVGARIELTKGPLDSDYQPDSPYDPDKLRDATVRYSVQIGQQRKRVSFDDTSTIHTLVVSAPKSVDPRLVVTVDGLDQSLSLTTGRRVSHTAPAFYRRHRDISLSKTYATAHVAKGEFDLTHTIRFTDAQLTAFHPVLGWADKGKSWLLVNTADRQYQWNDLYSITVDRAKTATVEDAKGQVSADTTPSQTEAYFIPSELIQLAFQVDAHQDRFRLTYQPHVSFQSQGPGPKPAKGTVVMRPMTTVLDFSR